MKVYRTVAEFEVDRSKTLALVPTMGAFHEGHLTLMRTARKSADQVAVSLFVNPTQFRAGEDFEKYPRDEECDFELADSAGVDFMFAPSVGEMYGSTGTTVLVGEIGSRWEGAYRPGHFEGVATVVAKLFNIVRPDVALFGLKDYQQCRVIARMVADLNFALRLQFEPTVREPDGLAMSSRNRYLSDDERLRAPVLYATLCQLAGAIRESSSGQIIQMRLAASKMALATVGFAVDYLELVDGETLAPARDASETNRLIVAAKLGATRLIDNVGLAE